MGLEKIPQEDEMQRQQDDTQEDGLGASTRRPQFGRHPLTDEQQVICDAWAAQQRRVHVIPAFAGCAKTTTLVRAAEALFLRRGVQSTYLAFNRSIADAARPLFRTQDGRATASVQNIHAMACRQPYRPTPGGDMRDAAFGGKTLGTIYLPRLSRTRAILSQAIQAHSHDAMDRLSVSLGVRRARATYASLILSTIRNFCNSDAESITTDHFPNEDGLRYMISARRDLDVSSPSMREAVTALSKGICGEARNVWERMASPASDMPIFDNVYLKVWERQGPGNALHHVLFDESQDANPAMLSLVKQAVESGATCMFVGDPYQSIYAWNGAVNAMDVYPQSPRLPLSTTWRFGQEIAKTAQFFLSVCGEQRTLHGAASDPGLVSDTPDEGFDGYDAVLCRSNAGVFNEAISCIEQGGSPWVVGNFSEFMTDVKSVWQLKNFMPVEPFNPRVSTFPSFKELVDFSQTSDGNSMRPCISVVKRHDSRVPELLESLQKYCATSSEGATVRISTVHQAKGLEFNRVRAGIDVQNVSLIEGYVQNEMDDEPSAYRLREEEVKLMYVLVTRARESLNTGGNMERWKQEIRAWMQAPLDEDNVRKAVAAFERHPEVGFSMARQPSDELPLPPSHPDDDHQNRLAGF